MDNIFKNQSVLLVSNMKLTQTEHIGDPISAYIVESPGSFSKNASKFHKYKS